MDSTSAEGSLAVTLLTYLALSALPRLVSILSDSPIDHFQLLFICTDEISKIGAFNSFTPVSTPFRISDYVPRL